jgi:branched-chain amino acid transport system ATP-binding protein
MALLELDEACKRYGDLLVVDNLSLEVAAGEILGLIGPNGAGKTTALSLIAGEVPMTSGSVRFAGQDITHLPVHRRCRLGIGRTFQVPRPFVRMTVLENVMVGALHGREGRGGAEQAAVDALRVCRLLGQANAPAGRLTLLERKRLEFARALVTKPQVMLLDESAAGLTEGEVHELLPTIENVRASGTAIVWTEHVLHALLAAADRVICIDRGRKLVEGPPAELLATREVQDVYLGLDVS